MATVLNTEMRFLDHRNGVLPTELQPRAEASIRASLALDLLLYDSTSLYVEGFEPLVELALWAGPDVLIELFASEALSVSWGPAMPAYLNDASSGERRLTTVAIERLATGEAGDPAARLRRAILDKTNWGRSRSNDFSEPILRRLDERVTAAHIKEAVEATRDVLRAGSVPMVFGLTGATEDDLRGDPTAVQRALRIAQANIAGRVAAEFAGSDVHAEPLAALAIPVGIVGLAEHEAVESGLAELVEVAGLPDTALFGADRIAFRKLVQLRRTTAGGRFRNWVANNALDAEAGRALLKEYVKEVRPEQPSVSRRVMRFALGGAVTVATAGLALPAQVLTSASATGLEEAGRKLGGWLKPKASLATFIDDGLGQILSKATGDGDPLSLVGRKPAGRIDKAGSE